SPDGNTLAAVAGPQGEVKLWDMAARKERATLRSDIGNCYSVAFSPDGKTLFLGHSKYDPKAGPTGGISVWDAATAQRKTLLRHPPPRGASRVLVTPDGNTLIALESWKEGEGDKAIHKSAVTLWDVARGTPQTSLGQERAGALALSPDGKVLAQTAYIITDK